MSLAFINAADRLLTTQIIKDRCSIRPPLQAPPITIGITVTGPSLLF